MITLYGRMIQTLARSCLPCGIRQPDATNWSDARMHAHLRAGPRPNQVGASSPRQADAPLRSASARAASRKKRPRQKHDLSSLGSSGIWCHTVNDAVCVLCVCSVWGGAVRRGEVYEIACATLVLCVVRRSCPQRPCARDEGRASRRRTRQPATGDGTHNSRIPIKMLVALSTSIWLTSSPSAASSLMQAFWQLIRLGSACRRGRICPWHTAPVYFWTTVAAITQGRAATRFGTALA